MAVRRSNRAITERHEVTLADFASALMDLSADTESVNGLVYGDSNVGKTHLAGTLPGKVLWLVAEPGFKTAPRNGAVGKAYRISNTAQALAAVDYLYSSKANYDWVVVDGLSTMQDRIRLAYAQEAFDVDPSKRQHRNLPDRPDYYNTQNFLLSWIPALIDAPPNMLITAHAYRTDKTDDGELMVFPGIQGKVNQTSNSVSGLMDFTGYMEIGKIKREGAARRARLLHFTPPNDNPDVRYICGSKFPGLQGKLVNPTMRKVMEGINA